MEKKKKRFTSRKIAREMAHRNMKREGLRRVNHVPKVGAKETARSSFQERWRDYVFVRGGLLG